MLPYPQPAGPAQPVQPAQPAPATYSPAQPPALPPGTILLDRYLIQGYIGGGGFGHIYKVLDSALGYRRALKEAFYQDQLTRRQFQLEAEFLMNARHPNLVRGYAVFEQMGRLYLVMDYVDGHTLEEIAIDHIRRTGRPLPEARILDWVIPICGALHALHASPVPVIHRDVKPANVKVNRRGIPILIDLGLAKLYARGTQTIGAALAFTPGYAPPEQYRAAGATDARTDVYGMGATLFYLLTGYQPTEAPARLGTLVAPPLRQLAPAVSAAMEAAVIRAMELDPMRRQQSALELEDELRGARAALDTARGLWGQPAAPAPTWPLVCARCGTANPPIARHCMRCAAFLDGSELAPDAPSNAPGAASLAPPRGEGVAGEQKSDGVSANAAANGSEPGPPASADAADLLVAGDASVRPNGHTAHSDDTAGADVPGERPPDVDGATGAAGPVDLASLNRAVSPNASDPLASSGPLALEPDSPPDQPDQPAMALPALRRGPAPAAMPLAHASGPGAWGPPPTPFKPDVPNRETADAPAGRQQPAASQTEDSRAAPRAQPRAVSLAPPALTQRVPRWQRALPSLRRWQAETLAAAAPTTETEVRAGIAGLMALVLAVGTLGAVQYLWTLALAAPALTLGHWCLHSKTAQPSSEARWLATLALVVGYAWLGLFTLGALILALHGRG